MNLEKNYYEILGLTNQAEMSEIKKRYKNQAVKLHPDKTNGDKSKEEQFKQISEAYSILSDPKKKQQYDAQSPHGRNYVGGNPFSGFGSNPFGGFGGSNPFEDIFSEIFGKRHTYQEFREKLDINMNVVISLRDVYSNDSIKIKYSRNVKCDVCNGSGFDPNSHSDTCEMCDGKGRDVYGKPCEYCQGKGKIHSGTCTKCNGEKVIKKEDEFNLNAIKNVRESNQQYLNGKGHQSKYYPNKKGVLILNVIYKHVKDYEIKGFDLYKKIDVHYQDAIDGKKIEYEHLDNKKLKIKIPKKTKDGDLIRIKNKGLLDAQDKRGNLYFKINIIIDYKRI